MPYKGKHQSSKIEYIDESAIITPEAMTELEKRSHIPTETIKKDIQDTQNEIDQYRAENEVLSKDRAKNKVAIYFNEGRILQRQKFVDRLNKILKGRTTNVTTENKQS